MANSKVLEQHNMNSLIWKGCCNYENLFPGTVCWRDCVGSLYKLKALQWSTIRLIPHCGLVLRCSSEGIAVAHTEEKISYIEYREGRVAGFQGKKRDCDELFWNSLDNCSLFNNRPSIRVKLLGGNLSSALTVQALKSFCTFKFWFHWGCSACIVLLLLCIPGILRFKLMLFVLMIP